MATIVKRKGHTEKFDEKKVYASVYAACTSAHYHETECESVADEITGKIKKMLHGKKSVNSGSIRKEVAKLLHKKDKDLAFFYEFHLPNLKRL
jgi:transcriptional regulator NrdR family protein